MPDDGGVSFSSSKGSEWDRVIAALAEVADTLANAIRSRVAIMVDPWIDQAEIDVESMPIKGVGKQTGLRDNVARHVSKNVDGVAEDFTVSVDANLPGNEGEQIIPLGLDRLTGWRHPVFGKRNTWVQQIPLSHEWFTDQFEGRDEEVSSAIEGVLEDAANRVDDAGE